MEKRAQTPPIFSKGFRWAPFAHHFSILTHDQNKKYLPDQVHLCIKIILNMSCEIILVTYNCIFVPI